MNLKPLFLFFILIPFLGFAQFTDKKVYNIEDIEKRTNKPNDQRTKFSKNKYNKNYNKKGKFKEKFKYKSNVEKKYFDNNKKSVSY